MSMTLIKKLYGWTACNILFWMGHLVSKVAFIYAPNCEICSKILAKFYPVYNKLMSMSMDVQERFGLKGPWVL